MIEKLSENVMDKVSIDFLRDQVLKNAYGNDDTPIAVLDPRVLLLWYLFFALVPWFLDDIAILLGMFILTAVTTRIARVAPLVLLIFALGVFSQTGYLFVASLFFGGDLSTVAPLLVLTLKVATVSLASITVFSGLDPDKPSNGLLWFGCPARGQGPLDRLSDQDHRAILLPADAQHRQALAHHGRGPRAQGVPLCGDR